MTIVGAGFRIRFLAIFRGASGSFRACQIAISYCFDFLTVFNLIPKNDIRVGVVRRFLQFVIVNFQLAIGYKFCVFEHRRVLVGVVLPIFCGLTIRRVSFNIVMVSRRRVGKDQNMFPVDVMISVFLRMRLTLATFNGPPALTNFRLVDCFLGAFRILNQEFQVLIESASFLCFVPIYVRIAFRGASDRFKEVFVRFVVYLVFEGCEVFAT